MEGNSLQWPADRVERRALDALLPYAQNARTHSDAQVDQLAASIQEWGWTIPVLVDEAGVIIAGHGRVMAARKLGIQEVPVMVARGWSEAQRRAYVLADNRLALNAGWDKDLLGAELQALNADGFDMPLLGFDEIELQPFLEPASAGNTDPDDVPEPQVEVVSATGDVWLLGKHRLMCGDSTDAADVERLMAGAYAQLLHADPPYGMGKASDGVVNDNLYREKLDRFQLKWWATFRAFLADNASAYIWGNAPDLWRLWYRGGLSDSERLELRNEIVWDKKAIPGMASPLLTQFPEASERCLYFQIGNQYLSSANINTEDFPEVWEGVRGYLADQAKEAGIVPSDVKRVCGCGMYSHWFTKSQFTLLPEKHYRALAAAYPGRFAKPWAELKAEWDRVRTAPVQEINGELRERRSYFDNAHDSMRDVWDFPRVTGDDRHDHATPKPVAMMERVMRSSLPPGGLCVEPFGGSGSTLMGAEITGRRCFMMELQAVYVDVTIRRWQEFTGDQATLEGDGRTFDQVQAERQPQPIESAS